MSQTREVWSALEATVTIMEEDASGNVIGETAVEDLYTQRASARPIRLEMSMRQPGVAFEETRSAVIGHEISLSSLYARAKDQIDRYMELDKKFRIRIAFVNERYPNVEPLENDIHEYAGASVREGPEYSYQDPEISILDLVLVAERKISG